MRNSILLLVCKARGELYKGMMDTRGLWSRSGWGSESDKVSNEVALLAKSYVEQSKRQEVPSLSQVASRSNTYLNIQ